MKIQKTVDVGSIKSVDTENKTIMKNLFLNQNEVKNLFRTTKNTIVVWGKKGILNPIKIGGKVYYKTSDIKSLINEKGNSK